MYRKFFKRFFDVVISGIGILMLLPFFILFTPIVAIAMRGNPFFVQKRPGKNRKIFSMLKYRTMTNKKDQNGILLPDEQRLTKFGKFLRATSLDELPEIFNIFIGDMSIIGPRPLLVQYLPLYNDFQNRRHEVRPGLTGLAQISGRNAISWNQKFEKDIEYIDSLSFKMDVKIFLLTIKKVLKRDDISQEGQATMEYFKGNDQDNSIEKKNMIDKNVLILSVGRRVELVKSFKAAQNNLAMKKAKVIAVDISKYAPALYFADRYYLVPKITDNRYIDTIIDISNKEDISLIVPTIDTELSILAFNKELIEEKTNAKVLVSSLECIEICNDKIKTIEFMRRNGFQLPNTLTNDDIKNKSYEFPLFVKPKSGSSSINTYTINNEKELQFFKEYVKEPIIQEMIKGKEYTVDVLMDFDSSIISVVPRIRMATRSGEILKGKIDKNPDLIEDVMRLMNVLKPIGHITVQCFVTNDNNIKYIEINPRFGGGAPMSFYAGANSPEFLLRMLNGEKLSYYEDYKDGLFFSRFDDSIVIEDKSEW